MYNARAHIDPEGLYQSEGLREFEIIAVFALEWRNPNVLARTRDAIEIRFPDVVDADRELLVLITPNDMELRLPDMAWTTGYGGPTPTSELWKRTPVSALTKSDVHGWLRKLDTSMKRRLRRCKYCEKRFIAARMHGRACHGCSSKHEGVVY
ncbi:MAG: hypothetical protein KC502_22145 [Myxococcales bacterium]|nr:hypothetical protein [Myxococcales bacterium]